MLQRGRNFTREIRIAGSLQALLSLSLLLALCFHPRLAQFPTWLERVAGPKLWRQVAVVSLGITLLSALIELPLSFYGGYLHEHAYGLSRQSISQWLGDYAIGLLIQTATGLLLWLPLYYLIRKLPRGWWLPAAGFNILFAFLMAALYPVLVLPLFNRIQPVQDPQVVAMVAKLAQKAGVEVTEVKQLQVSEKSARLNAMVTGLGPTKQVLVYNTLLEQMTPGEVEVVLAHELAHAAYGDVLTGWLVSSGLTIIAMGLAAWIMGQMTGVAPLNLPAPYAARGLAALLLFLSLFDHLAGPVMNNLSRRMEVRADRFALRITGNPSGMVSSFQKLARHNPSDVDPPPSVEFFSHSHPSILNRIRSAVRWSR